MAFRSSSRPPPTPRRQSSSSQNPGSAHPADSHAADLAQSLQKLSLATSPGAAPQSPRSTPLRNASSLASPGPAANSRFSPRSPSNGRESRSATPSLLRKSSTSSLRSSSTGPRQSLSRRASSANLSSPLPKSPLAMGEPVPEPKPPLTANSVAKDFFLADLDFQQGDDDRRPTEVTVVLHDSCYGHRFSRPPATVEDLASIVERPERLKASSLGVAMAYVRLGGRHADGEHDVHPKRDPTTIPHLPFRIRRTNRRMSLLSAPVVAVHGKDTMKELEAMCNSALSKLATKRIEVERNNKAKPELHSGDLYLGPHSLEAMEGAIGAVCEAVDTVFTHGPRRSYVSIRPPGHHCSADYPSGFCWVNNVHVGIIHAMMNHGLTHAAIIDFDLHHGDGSQAITWNYNERHTYSKGRGGLSQWKKGSIGYFSLHDIQSYPCESGNLEKTVNASVCIEDAHGQNIWNVHLKPWANKAEFWELYETRYSVLLEKARSYLKTQSEKVREAGKAPKSAIFVSAGFDASEWESGGMQRHAGSVPTDFYARITEDVVKMAADPETGTDGRIISVMEGGYSDRAIYSGVCSHLSGLVSNPSQKEEAVDSDLDVGQDQARLGMEMGQRLGLTTERQLANPNSNRSSPANVYDPNWWSGPELDHLERVLGIAPRQPKKPRNSLPPTYSSPTHASTARAADPVKLHRSLNKNGQPTRPPSPPPPEVPWAVAVQELRNLLVPETRPTDSCTVAEINEIVTQARQECRVTPPNSRSPTESQAPTPTTGQRAGLRGRRPKMIEAISEENGVGKPRVKTSPALVCHITPNLYRLSSPNALEQHSSRGYSEAPSGVRRSSRRASTASVLTSVDDDAAPDALNSSVSSHGSRVSDTAGAPLQAKKVRATPAPRREPAARAPRDPVKKAPARPAPPKRASTSAVAKGKAKVNGPQPPAASTSEKPSIKVSESEAQRDGASGGIDSITSGMNKVKITLVGNSGREADEGTQAAESVAAPSLPAPKPRIKIVSRNASPDRPKTSDAIQTIPPAQPDDIKQEAQSPAPSTTTPVETPPASTPDPRALPLPSSSPEQPGPKTPDMFIPYQPDGPTPAGLPLGDNVRFLPPNAATPTPMKRVDLPKFTPTSAIPFATREEGCEREEDVWELPATPLK